MTGLSILNEDGQVIYEEEVWFEYKKDPERIIYIVDRVVNKLDKNTDIVCIENFSYGSTGASQSFQYMLGGVFRENLVRHGITYYDVAPGGVKKFATGNGSSNKDVMIAPIYKRWGYTNQSDNVTDAFILAKIAEYLDKGIDDLKEHEKQVIRVVKKSVLNQDKWELQKPPPKVRRKRLKMIEEIKGK